MFKRRHTLSLNSRIITALLVMLTIILGTLSLYLPYSTTQLRRVVAHIEARTFVQDFAQHRDINALPQFYKNDPLSYTLYSAQGEVLQQSKNLSEPKKLRRYVIREQNWWPRFDDIGTSINVPVYLSNGQILMVAKQDSVSRSYIEDIFTSLLTQTAIMIIPLFLLSSALMWLLLRWTLAPVKKAAMQASQISQNNLLSINIKDMPQEIIPLARATNDAVLNLSSAYQNNQQFTADAAHQLRTPLTVLNLELENTAGTTDLVRARDALKQMKSLVNQLLQLASLEAPQANRNQQPQLFDICRLWREVSATHFALFENAGRTLAIDLPKGKIVCQGQPILLQRAFDNVLENALQHGKGLTRISIFKRDGKLLMQVSDEGEAPPHYLQQQLFSRFMKADQATSGTGLGLAIVQQTLENMNGSVRFLSDAHTTVSMEIPLLNTP